MLPLSLALAGLVVPARAADKLFGGTTSWVNGPWTPTGYPGPNDNAQFGTLPNSTYPQMGINMTNISPQYVVTCGSIEVLSTRNNLSWSIGNSTGLDGEWTFNGNTLNSVPNTVIRNNGSGTTTLTLQDAYGAHIGKLPIVFNTPDSAVIDATKGVVISSVIKKADYGITKIGVGTLTLSGNNTYTGSVAIAAGKVNVQHNNALGTNGTVTIGAGIGNQLILGATDLNVARSLVMNGGGATGQATLHFNQASGSATYSGNISITAPAEAGGHFSANGGELILTGPVTSSTDIKIRAGKVRFSNAGSSYGSVFIVGTATLVLGVTNAIPVSAAVDMATGTSTSTSVFDLNGFSQELAGLTRNANAVTYGSTATVDNTAADTTPLLTLNITNTSEFAGAINNTAGSLSLTKKGPGTLTLSGGNSFSGATTVSAGTLLVNGNNGPSTVVVEAGGTLGGNGIIGGAVTVNTNGTLSPGASIGALTINNDLTLRGNTIIEIDRGAGTNDFVSGINILSAGGTLTVVNLGSPVQAGDAFRVFSANDYSGSFSSVSGAGVSWVLTNGVLAALSGESVGQPTLAMSRSDNTLTFTWSGSYKLQAQTNAAGIQIGSSNWLDYPNGSTSPATATVNTANPSVFFRLRSP
jgi:autotransporter-associated beta strand protein